jgi:exopolysaccharide biosynthesis polyprenyl glycosylphosphotransferase
VIPACLVTRCLLCSCPRCRNAEGVEPAEVSCLAKTRMIERQVSPRRLESLPAPSKWIPSAADCDRDIGQRNSLRRRILAAADGVAVLLGGASLATTSTAGVDAALWTAALAPLWLLFAGLQGLYERDERALRHLTVDEVPAIAAWALSGTAATALVLLATPVGSLHVAVALQLWAVVVALAVALRALARLLWRLLTPPERALVVGGGMLAESAKRKIELFPDIHASVAGQVDGADADAFLSRPSRLAGIDRLVLAAEEVEPHLVERLLALSRREGIALSWTLPPALAGAGLHLDRVAELPVMVFDARPHGRAFLLVKRLLDVVLPAIALVVFLPLLVVVALAVRLDGSGPVVFRQDRAGLNGRSFRMFKFRTMVGDAEEHRPAVGSKDGRPQPMFKSRSDPRITRLGRVLRRTSLDELPQLLNVLRGDMSLVGPRPELAELVAHWPPEHRIRLSVKPGLTGPMQVYGRSNLTFEEWLAVEREYIENPSLTRDLRILALTIPVATIGRGAF